MSRKRRIMCTIAYAAAASGIPIHACVNPADQWAAGIVWNNGESADFSRIEQAGTEGLDYIRLGSGDTLVYRFRSHFAPEYAMVYLGYFTVSYQTDITVPRVAIILDTLRDADAFDFASAVRVELDWLTNPALAVVEMTMGEKRAAEDALRAAGSGGVQYWTLQRGVLSYNQWYTNKGEDGVYGVNGVRGGCGLDAAFEVPPRPLSSAGLSDTFSITFGDVRFAVTNLRTGELRMAGAVRELNGQYCMPVMSRWPTFMDNQICGYFERDSVPYIGDDTVFIITEIIGQASMIKSSGSTAVAPATSLVQSFNMYSLQGRALGAAVARNGDVNTAGVYMTQQGGKRRLLLHSRNFGFLSSTHSEQNISSW